MKQILSDTITASPEETLDVGRHFAQQVKPGDVVCLMGELGAGKTHFTKGFSSFFGVSSDIVSSPTYALVQEYKGAEIAIHHIDAYRLTSAQEALEIGLDELLESEGICVVEWPERITELLPDRRWQVEMSHCGDTHRRVVISYVT